MDKDGDYARRRRRSSSSSQQWNAKVARVESATSETDKLVHALSAVNGGIIDALRQRVARVLGSRHEWRSRAQELTDLLLASHGSRAHAELRRAQTASVAEYQEHAIRELGQQVSTITETASDAVSSRLSASWQSALTAMEARLTTEEDINNELVEQVRSFTEQSMAVLSASSERSLHASLDATGKEVVIARLQTALTLELARHSRYYDEVDALMRIVATLAERSRRVDTTTAALEKAKDHVRALENHLDLNGIIAAVAPSERIPVARARQGISPAAPSAELQKRTPQYFAVRMMEHKDMTLSELVEAWLGQEERIVSAENRYAELEDSVAAVERNATLVHQQYLEEKQRREISDRRITEMVRERVRSSTDGGIVDELNQLRWSYSKVVDDAAQLAVSLKLSREELADTQRTVNALRQRVRQLERDAQVDQVAATLAELREHYQSTMDSLQNDFAEAELQRRILASTVERRQEMCAAAHQALELSRENTITLSEEMRTTVKHMNEGLVKAQAELAGRDANAHTTEKSLTEAVRAMRAVVDDLQAQTQRFQTSQDAAFDAYGKQLERLVGAASNALAHSKSVSDSSSSASPTSLPSAAVADDGVEERAAATAGQLSTMRSVLNDAMLFVTRHLESTDTQRTSLVDASISDAEYVSFLVQKLKQVTEQRDSLQEQVREARTVIKQNHLTLVGQALMHEVSVQDSLDTAEAAERIASLQEQLNTTQLVRRSAMDEILDLTKRRDELEAEVGRLHRENERLLLRCDAVTASLERSHGKERGLLASHVNMQSRVLAALQSVTGTADGDDSADTTDSAPAETDTERQARANTALEAVLTQFGSQIESMTAAIRDATARKQTAAAAGGATMETGEGGDADAEAAKAAAADYLARTGLNGVVELMADTFQKARVLKQTMAEKESATTMALADAAGDQHQLLSPEARMVAEKAHRIAELEETVRELQHERSVMEQKLARTEEVVNKAGENNQKLLDMLKKLNAAREAKALEVQSLRDKVAELSQAAQRPTEPVEETAPQQVPREAVEASAPPPDPSSSSPATESGAAQPPISSSSPLVVHPSLPAHSDGPETAALPDAPSTVEEERRGEGPTVAAEEPADDEAAAEE